MKALMGEHPVVTESDAVATKRKKGQEEGDVHPSNVGVPEKDNGGDHSEDR